MSDINKANAFDPEIIEASRRIERLTLDGAPYAQIEEAQYKLSRLVDLKRQSIFQATDPSYFIDQFIGCPTPEDRRKKAIELSEGALAAINAIEESDEVNDSTQLDTFISIVDFFRYFAAKDSDRVFDDADIGSFDEAEDLTFPDVFIQANPQRKISSLDLSDMLVEYGYLTEENRRLFVNRISSSRSGLSDESLRVAWARDIHSAATMLTIACELGILSVGIKQNPNSTNCRDTIAAAILNTFSFVIGRPLTEANYEQLVYRHTKEAKDAIKGFRNQVEAERSARFEERPRRLSQQPRMDYKPLVNLADIISEYDNIKQDEKALSRIRRICKHMDIDIINIFIELIAREA